MTRLPKRYLALAFAVCIGLLSLMDALQTPTQADAFDKLFDGRSVPAQVAEVSFFD